MAAEGGGLFSSVINEPFSVAFVGAGSGVVSVVRWAPGRSMGPGVGH